MSLIHVNHLTFSYEGSYDTIFDDISFQIDTAVSYTHLDVYKRQAIKGLSSGALQNTTNFAAPIH